MPEQCPSDARAMPEPGAQFCPSGSRSLVGSLSELKGSRRYNIGSSRSICVGSARRVYLMYECEDPMEATMGEWALFDATRSSGGRRLGGMTWCPPSGPGCACGLQAPLRNAAADAHLLVPAVAAGPRAAVSVLICRALKYTNPLRMQN